MGEFLKRELAVRKNLLDEAELDYIETIIAEESVESKKIAEILLQAKKESRSENLLSFLYGMLTLASMKEDREGGAIRSVLEFAENKLKQAEILVETDTIIQEEIGNQEETIDTFSFEFDEDDTEGNKLIYVVSKANDKEKKMIEEGKMSLNIRNSKLAIYRKYLYVDDMLIEGVVYNHNSLKQRKYTGEHGFLEEKVTIFDPFKDMSVDDFRECVEQIFEEKSLSEMGIENIIESSSSLVLSNGAEVDVPSWEVILLYKEE